MVKLEIVYSDDREGIQLIQVTFSDGRRVSMTPFFHADFVAEAEKVIDQAALIEEMVKKLK